MEISTIWRMINMTRFVAGEKTHTRRWIIQRCPDQLNFESTARCCIGTTPTASTLNHVDTLRHTRFKWPQFELESFRWPKLTLAADLAINNKQLLSQEHYKIVCTWSRINDQRQSIYVPDFKKKILVWPNNWHHLSGKLAIIVTDFHMGYILSIRSKCDQILTSRSLDLRMDGGGKKQNSSPSSTIT